MEQKITIRNEEQKDWAVVEKITRQAFYNLYVPGCVEHYLVHIMREHEDFIPELDFVLELNGDVIGNIMYTKAKLTDENGCEKDILTFGPVSIHPAYQRMGYGKMLMEHSFQAAVQFGYDTIIIFGSPSNYVSRGFKSCKKYNVCIENGKYPAVVCTPSSRQRNNLHFTHENPSCIPYGAGCYAASRRSWTSIGVRTPRPRWRRWKL